MYVCFKFEGFMNIKKIIMVSLITVCMVAGLAGCSTYDNFKDTFFGDKGTKSDKVTIGVLEPKTGDRSEQGDAEVKGIELAHKLHGTVLGKKVELVYEDTQSSVYTTESAAKNLVSRKPAAILGPYGDACALAAGKYLRTAKIPGIAITATNPLITQNNEYYFRTSFSEASQGTALANYIAKGLKQNRVTIITVAGDDTVNDMVNNFTREYKSLFKSKKGKKTKKAVIDEIQIAKNDSNLESCISQLEEDKANTVFMATPYDNARELLTELNRLKVRGLTFVGPKEWHNDKILSLQSGLKGIKIAVASDFNVENTDTKYYDEFVKAYKDEYGSEAQDQSTALGFDAYMLAVKAVEKANSTDGTKVRDALAATKNYSGASGVITFNSSGNPKKPVNIDIIKSGSFKSVYTVK